MADEVKIEVLSPESKIRNKEYSLREGARRITFKSLYDELTEAITAARRSQHIGCLLYVAVKQKASLTPENLRELHGELEKKIGLFCRPGDAVAPLAQPHVGWAIVIQQLAVRDEALLLCERLESLSIRGIFDVNVGLSLFPVQSIRPPILWTKARRNLMSGVKRPKVRRSLACDTLRITADSKA